MEFCKHNGIAQKLQKLRFKRIHIGFQIHSDNSNLNYQVKQEGFVFKIMLTFKIS